MVLFAALSILSGLLLAFLFILFWEVVVNTALICSGAVIAWYAAGHLFEWLVRRRPWSKESSYRVAQI
jgi:hypothetical protein